MYSSSALAHLISLEHTSCSHCGMIHEELIDSAHGYSCLQESHLCNLLKRIYLVSELLCSVSLSTFLAFSSEMVPMCMHSVVGEVPCLLRAQVPHL